MHNIKDIRDNLDNFKKLISKRNVKVETNNISELEKEIEKDSVREILRFLNKSTDHSNFKIVLIDNAEYLNISLNLNISDQLSSITISTDYDIDEDHGGLVFKLSLYRENPLIETDEYPNGDVNIYFTQTNNVDSVMYGDVNNDNIALGNYSIFSAVHF